MRQALHARTTTVMFTDVVGSTQLIQRLGHEAARGVLELHRERLQRALRLTGGREVQWLGDGALTSFDGTGDAVRCAIILQKSLTVSSGTPLQLRIGINVGDLLFEAGDSCPFGLPLVVARRLCDRANAGQILCSAVVEAMTLGRAELQFRALGNVKLKGIEGQIPVCEVSWARGASAAEVHLLATSQAHCNGTLPEYQA